MGATHVSVWSHHFLNVANHQQVQEIGNYPHYVNFAAVMQIKTVVLRAKLCGSICDAHAHASLPCPNL